MQRWTNLSYVSTCPSIDSQMHAEPSLALGPASSCSTAGVTSTPSRRHQHPGEEGLLHLGPLCHVRADVALGRSQHGEDHHKAPPYRHNGQLPNGGRRLCQLRDEHLRGLAGKGFEGCSTVDLQHCKQQAILYWKELLRGTEHHRSSSRTGLRPEREGSDWGRGTSRRREGRGVGALHRAGQATPPASEHAQQQKQSLMSVASASS